LHHYFFNQWKQPLGLSALHGLMLRDKRFAGAQ
jgi:hypothetical protein